MPALTLRVLHLVAGGLVGVAFLLTGQYMDFHDPRMEALDAGSRMMFRSRHIYVLFAGLLNLAIGAYVATTPPGWRRVVQRLGSLLLLLAGPLSLAAFFTEPSRVDLPNTLTLPAVVSLAIGTLCHIAAAGTKKG